MSDIPIDRIERLIRLCKAEGVRRLRLGEIELDLAPLPAEGPDEGKMRELAEALAGNTMSDEEALFASAPQYRTQEEVEKMLKQITGQG